MAAPSSHCDPGLALSCRSVRIDERERTTRRERLGREPTIKAYRSEALYHQAWAAFQANDAAAAAKLALEAGSEPGQFQLSAKFLYGDSLYRQSDFAGAKQLYLDLRNVVHGGDRAIAAKKIAACNKQLNLPDDDGIHDN